VSSLAAAGGDALLVADKNNVESNKLISGLTLKRP